MGVRHERGRTSAEGNMIAEVEFVGRRRDVETGIGPVQAR
jgi:hypothetical protein